MWNSFILKEAWLGHMGLGIKRKGVFGGGGPRGGLGVRVGGGLYICLMANTELQAGHQNVVTLRPLSSLAPYYTGSSQVPSPLWCFPKGHLGVAGFQLKGGDWGLTRVPSSEAWTARSEVLKRGAPQQPRKQKSNNAQHSPQNNPNKHQ